MSATVEEFANRVFASALGAAEIYSIHIGDRLGLYRAMAPEGKTSLGLAVETGIDERYAREWLERRRPTASSTSIFPVTTRHSPSPIPTVKY